ncbi:MAG TPA: hypothetical protein VLY04_13855 [Bryobacteraceae bacterium]|nr:hypothetical protein [Bryobacteraceae bacterium]
MKVVRYCLCSFVIAVISLFAAELPSETLRGKIRIHEGKPAAVETADHKLVVLDGDESTKKILNDERLNGFQVEARGRFTAEGKFLIDPIHTRALLVRQDGRLKMITYFCEVCNIRAYTPGNCVCCQRETTLDLRDPDQ